MDLKEIRDLMRSFDKSGLGKLKLKDGDFEITFQKGVEVQNVAQVQQTKEVIQVQPESKTVDISLSESSQQKEIDSLYIKSPMVGTFYQAPSPGAAPFVQVGDSVKKGDTVAIIEAMKIMNEIESEFNCKILEILVSDGEPVEFDQPLFRVEKL